MVSGRHKSHSFRKVFVKTPGGKTVTRYLLRKVRIPTCPVTGQKLAGASSGRPRKMKNMPKSKKRPTRAFGGHLSSPAARRELINRARKL